MSVQVIPSIPWQGSDGELLERLRQRDRSAAAVLFDRFSRDVNRLVYYLLGPDADHDDLVQEVFLRAWDGAERLQDAAKLLGFAALFLALALFRFRHREET